MYQIVEQFYMLHMYTMHRRARSKAHAHTHSLTHSREIKQNGYDIAAAAAAAAVLAYFRKNAMPDDIFHPISMCHRAHTLSHCIYVSIVCITNECFMWF